MGMAEHRIGRVSFAVTGTDAAALRAAGAAMQARFDAIIAPALEAALDGVDRAGTLVRLDRIEVDLGRLSEAAWTGANLRGRIAAALARAMPAGGAGLGTDRGADGGVDGHGGGVDPAADLAGFLATGRLDWVEPGRALAVLTAALLALDAAGMARLAARLRVVLIRRAAAERAARQLPRALLRRLLCALLPPALAGELARIFGPDGLAGGGTADGMGGPYLAEPWVGPAAEMLVGLARARPPGPELGAVCAIYAGLLGAAAPAMPTPVAGRAGPGARASDRMETDDAERAVGDAGDLADTMPVHGAGVVILAPFLGDFFAACGLLDREGAFVDAAAQARAVLLTHYLATGAEAAVEPETMLCKLLCGMDFATPLPREAGFSDRERDEARELLETVIAHWDRLGATTPDGLREAFLRRPGRLERLSGPAGAGWRLRLEPSGVDVLLSFVPWPIGLIRTAFMSAPLRVDWR